MKVNYLHLQKAIERLRNNTGHYGKDTGECIFDIELVEENPGSGVMTSVMKVTLAAPPQKDSQSVEDYEHISVVEIYPANDKVEPRCTETKTYTIKRSY